MMASTPPVVHGYCWRLGTLLVVTFVLAGIVPRTIRGELVLDKLASYPSTPLITR